MKLKIEDIEEEYGVKVWIDTFPWTHYTVNDVNDKTIVWANSKAEMVRKLEKIRERNKPV